MIIIIIERIGIIPRGTSTNVTIAPMQGASQVESLVKKKIKITLSLISAFGYQKKYFSVRYDRPRHKKPDFF